MTAFEAHTRRDGSAADIRLPQDLWLAMCRERALRAPERIALAILGRMYQFQAAAGQPVAIPARDFTDLNMSRRSVFLGLARLEAAGLLIRSGGGGRGRPSTYSLNLKGAGIAAPFAGPERVQPSLHPNGAGIAAPFSVVNGATAELAGAPHQTRRISTPQARAHAREAGAIQRDLDEIAEREFFLAHLAEHHEGCTRTRRCTVFQRERSAARRRQAVGEPARHDAALVASTHGGDDP